MISVLIPVDSDEPALIDTLAALVPAAADGLVRDLVLTSAEDTEFLRQVADAAGCGTAVHLGERDLLARSSASLKGPWALVLTPGFVPGGDWMAEASDFLEQANSTRDAAVFSLAARGGASARLKATLMNVRASLLGLAHPHLGLLTSLEMLANPKRRPTLTRLASPVYDRRSRSRGR